MHILPVNRHNYHYKCSYDFLMIFLWFSYNIFENHLKMTFDWPQNSLKLPRHLPPITNKTAKTINVIVSPPVSPSPFAHLLRHLALTRQVGVTTEGGKEFSLQGKAGGNIFVNMSALANKSKRPIYVYIYIYIYIFFYIYRH